jgi:hypothetical protein
MIWMGALTVIMCLTCPVCHTHYFVLCIPLIMGLLAVAWQRNQLTYGAWALAGLMIVHQLGQMLPHIPELTPTKHLGVPLAVVLMLWVTGLAVLLRGDVRGVVATRREHPLRQAA